jgi:hypothetical protein
MLEGKAVRYAKIYTYPTVRRAVVLDSRSFAKLDLGLSGFGNRDDAHRLLQRRADHRGAIHVIFIFVVIFGRLIFLRRIDRLRDGRDLDRWHVER